MRAMLALPTVNTVMGLLRIWWDQSSRDHLLHVADDFGVVGGLAQARGGIVPQLRAQVRERRRDTERMGEVVGGADILRHQTERKAGVEGLRNDELLELEFGGVVLARGDVENVRHQAGV